MECYDAQALISEALDDTAPDAAQLEAAKQHCRECTDCANFVRALNLVKRVGLPEPPAGLTDRVMAAVRSEAAAEKARAEVAAAAAAAALAAMDTVSQDAGAGLPGTAATTAAGSQTGADGATPIPLQRDLKLPRSAVLAAWVGAAAVLVASVGTVGVMGIRLMSGEQSNTSSRVLVGAASAPSDAGSVNQAPPPAAENATVGAAKGTSVSTGSDFIAFNGIAYRLVGPSALKKNQLTSLGTTKTSLDGDALRERSVMGVTGAPGIYLEGDQADLLEFQPLERTFEGRTYRLRSAELPAFGAWPAMPSDIAQPDSADGSPTFSATGTDPSGVTIYRLTSSAAAEGIAVAPGAPANDPVSGNPNWTWWTPTP